MAKLTRQRSKRPHKKVEAWVERPVFVRIPPASIEHEPGEPWPVLNLLTDLRENQEIYQAGILIRTDLDSFTQTQDPIALMQGFVLSMNLGLYPPVAILQALAGAFQEVLDSKGTKTLDGLLGLRGNSQHTWNPWTKATKKNRQHWVALTIFSLSQGYKMSIDKAAERVALFLESHPDLGRYTVNALIDQYSRKWKKEFHLDSLSPTDFRHPDSWTPTQRDDFLKQFPHPAK